LKPILAGLFDAFGSIATAISDNSEKLEPFFNLLKKIGTLIIDTLGPAIGTVLGTAFTVIGKAISAVITLFANLVSVITDVVNGIKSIISLVANNPLVKGIGGVISSVFGGGKASGGPVMSGTSYLVGEKGPELFSPTSNGFIKPNSSLGGNTVINLNVTGAIDPEGTARSIVTALNNSYYRGTNGAAALVF
jgi:hypothetical protein